MPIAPFSHYIFRACVLSAAFHSASTSAFSIMSTARPGSVLDVAIVGGGISGLAAARRLAQGGLQVKVFEGLNRLGGRMHSQYNDGGKIEIGAQWFHGTVDNPVYDFAAEKGLLVGAEEGVELQRDIWSRMRSVREGGDEYDSDFLFRTATQLEGFWEELEENPQGVEDATAGAFMRRRTAEWCKHADRPEEVQRVLERKLRMRASIEGGHPDVMSPLQAVQYEDLGGNLVLLPPKGYSAVIHALAADIPEGVVQLGSRVNAICWDDQHEGAAQVRVHLDGGGRVEARCALVTVSLGVLKSSAIEFRPPLPPAKRRAVERLGIGQVEKLHFEFNDEQWRTLEELHLASAELYLMLWIVTPEECGRVQRCSDQALIDALEGLMQQYVKDPARVPRALSLLRSNWTTDPLFFGSYSFMGAGAGAADIEALGSPAGESAQLLFAGEATSSRHFGTVHGAFEAGEREALRALKELRPAPST